MTNAEKLVKDLLKDTEWFAEVLTFGLCSTIHKCADCPLHKISCSAVRTKEWLESEVTEDAIDMSFECHAPECCGNCYHKTMYNGEVDTCHCDRDWNRNGLLDKCEWYLPNIESEKDDRDFLESEVEEDADN